MSLFGSLSHDSNFIGVEKCRPIGIVRVEKSVFPDFRLVFGLYNESALCCGASALVEEVVALYLPVDSEPSILLATEHCMDTEQVGLRLGR